LIKAGRPSLVRAALLAAAVAWAPLALLSALHGDFASFIVDFGVHGRSLIATASLILAEAVWTPRLARVARHFVEAGLVAEADRPCYEHAMSSTRKLLNSRIVEILTVALAYAITAALFFAIRPNADVPLWHGVARGDTYSLSPAGWWAFLVSLPILLVLLLGWLWRVFLWTRFLWLMSQMPLRLVPTHPDGVAGLRFVSSSLKGFLPLAFTLGVLAAGPVLNQVFHQGASALQFKYVVVGVAAFVVALCAGPLLVFARRLIGEEYRGVFEFGALTTDVEQQLERKWLARRGRRDADALEVQDFSATTDLNSITANVYRLRIVPIDARNLLLLVAATLLPFVPVLFVVPTDAFVRIANMLI
jgi:hypothetical protein